MSVLKTEPIDERLDRMFAGESVDWKRATIPAARLRDRFFAVATEDRPRAVTIRNARIEGDLNLDEIGELSAPLALQLIDCRLGVFRARSSRWRQLLIAKSRLKCIDLPQSQVDRSVSIEGCKVAEWLEMRECRIGGTLALNSSRFSASGDHEAVMLSSTSIGSDLAARNIAVRGCFKADRIKVGGNVQLDGAELDGRPGEDEPKALDLSRARIDGAVQLAPGDNRVLIHGRIHIDASEIGAFIIKAAKIDGCGPISIVGDQTHIRETLDLTGLTKRGLQPLEVKGAMRFGSATIGKQVQLGDALLDAGDDCIIFYNCKVGGDLLVGDAGVATRFKGALNANACEIAGRLILSSIEFDRPDGAVSARLAQVAREVSCYDLKSNGCFDLGNIEAAGIEFVDIQLGRAALPPVRAGLPEPYSQPEDVLLDLSFSQLRGDLRVENAAIANGNLRMISASVGRGVQFSRVAIISGGRLALLAQNARIGTSFAIAGTPSVPAWLDGEVTMLGLNVAGDVSFQNVRIGSQNAPAKLVLHNAIVETSVTLSETKCHGPVVASGARVGGDFLFHSADLIHPGEVCCDLRGVRIGGKLQWATTYRDEPTIACRIDGGVTADGAMIGSLSWHRVELAAKASIEFTNMQIERRIDADILVCVGPAQINLSGTTVPLLVDRFGDRDSWSTAFLGLDNFTYGQLTNPSGGNGDEAGEIVKRRTAWLDRRFDPTSARPARHLASILRQQGLFEASRRLAIAAFNAEGWARPTFPGRFFAHIFGTFFGHGLSGTRAAFTVAFIWSLGVSGTIDLKDRDLLIKSGDINGATVQSCGTELNPYIYPLDVMIPLDLGEEARCTIGAGTKADRRTGYAIDRLTLGATVPTAKALMVFYKLLAWIALSLAIATWSGLFKRAGRE